MKNLNKVLTILLSICTALVVLTVREYCLDPAMWEALGLDPNQQWYSEQYDGDIQNRIENALITHPELFDGPKARALQQQKNASSQNINNSASNGQSASDKTVEPNKAKSKKVTAYFTDMYGHVIGKSSITYGTNIAPSQFPDPVNDVESNGNVFKFDSWDYTGFELYHDTIIRALYK